MEEKSTSSEIQQSDQNKPGGFFLGFLLFNFFNFYDRREFMNKSGVFNVKYC